MSVWRFAVVIALCLAVLAPTGVRAEDGCLRGLIQARSSPEVAGPYEGYWQYTVLFDWHDPNVDWRTLWLDPRLESCACACEDTFLFEPRSGYVDLIPTRCKEELTGSFACDGNPLVEGSSGPSLMYTPLVEICEPAASGNGLFRFYSSFPPARDGVFAPRLFGLTAASEVCFGELRGAPPACDCVINAEEESWGRIKGGYRNP